MVSSVKLKMQENPYNVRTMHNPGTWSTADILLQNDICPWGHRVYNEISYVI
jgi:hypothetical protein